MHDVEGYSRALYANWFWHKGAQVIVDAGEGLHLALRTGVWAPNLVAITHGHSDHVLGLPGFAAARRFGKGATTRPWTVLYPEGSTGVAAVRELIVTMWRGVEFPIEWKALAPGASHALSLHRTIEAFAVTHVPGEPTVGYRIVEKRRRLRPEFRDLPPTELERRARTSGRDALMEDYQHIVFVHSGDAMPIDPALARGAELLVHDATFLEAEDRREPIHASTAEALAVARDAGVSALVLNHLSVRYDRESAFSRMKAQLAESGFTGECWWLDEGTFLRLNP